MPHHFQLILHRDKQVIYAFETEGKEEQKEFETAVVPSWERPQLGDAVFFWQLLVILNYQFLLGKNFSVEDSANLMFILRNILAFDTYAPFHIELGESLKRKLTEEKNAEPTRKELAEILAKNRITATDEILDELTQPRKDKARTSYTLIPFLRNQSAARQDYFKKLGLTTENHNKPPATYLIGNLKGIEEDRLAHVRQCEHPDCTLNPLSSTFIANVNNNVGKQVIEYIQKCHSNKNETIYYGGFASGNLNRDLKIIADLIKLEYKNFEFFFLDTSYADLIKLIDEASNLALQDEVRVSITHKAILEFSKWIAAHVNCSKKSPIKIHLFGDIIQAEHFFQANKTKLTMLIGQDFWTPDGCFLPNTPDAHAHFMRFAKAAVAPAAKGRFFELVKQDKLRKFYFHIGQIKKEAHEPLSTNEIDPVKKTTTVYLNASVGLFSDDCRDDSIASESKDEWAVYNEHNIFKEASRPELEKRVKSI